LSQDTGLTAAQLLRLREFRFFLLARVFSETGDRVIFVMLAFAALHLGASPGQVGLVLVARELPVVLGVVLGGLVGGRLPHKTTLIGADAIRCVAQAATTVILLSDQASLWQLAVLQAVTASATALSLPVSEAMVADVVPEQARQRANALLGMVRSIIRVAAPASAGVVVAAGGIEVAFTVNACAFAVSALLLAGLVTRHAPLAGAGWRASLQLASRVIRGSRWLLTATLISAFTNALCIAPVLVLGPIIAETTLDGATSWAVMLTGFGAGAALGGLLLLRLRPRYPLRIAMATSLSLCLFPAALALGAPLEVMTATAFIAGLQATVYNTVTETARQNHFPPEARVQASALTAVVAFSSIPVGMALAGWWAAVSGTGPVLWFAVTVALAAPLWGFGTKEVRRLPAAPATATDTPLPER
jgi:MFS family permease